MSSNRVVTFGCRLNTYESAVIQELSEKAGFKGAIFINTCAVTKEAERQAKQNIRKIRRENPDAPIVVTGCAAQINPDMFAQMPEVTHVIGNQEKMTLEAYTKLLEPAGESVLVNDIFSIKETASHLVSGFEGKQRAFIQIQNGCNHRCTFCIIPYGRGNSRSVPLGDIADQVRHLLENGFHEIVLTGVDITDYGLDLPGTPTLGQTVKRLLALVPELKRLRLSSLDPAEIDEDLWTLIANEPRVMPHLHISLQAGDDLILKRMKRRHLRHHIISFCKRTREYRPDVSLGADIIAGFPTETEEHFLNTYNLVEECDLTFLHVFPFSPRPGTPAARMPQVHPEIAKERAARLRQHGEANYVKFLDRFIGQTVSYLVENQEDGYFLGKTDHFLPIRCSGSAFASVGQARIISRTSTSLEGEKV